MLSENSAESAQATALAPPEDETRSEELDGKLQSVRRALAELRQRLSGLRQAQTMGSFAEQADHTPVSTAAALNRTTEADWDELHLAHRILGELPHDAHPRGATADSTPLQIWEGTVLDVDETAQFMHVILDAKMDDTPRHTGEIDLEWVAEQDRDLVRPGAVFYLTLFKRTTRGSVQNAQELRFRRRPAWSAAQIKQIERDAAMLHAKMKPARTAP